MTTPLFSTYRQGENRVTATFLAVLQRLSQPNVDRILRTLLGEDTFSLVSFQNQIRAKESVPDAVIRGTTIWVETKTERDAVHSSQIRNHLKSVSEDQKLLVLTPDEARPPVLDDSEDFNNRTAWSNFNTLQEVISTILDDEEEPPTERESYLLKELVSMLRYDGLLGKPANVAVVAATSAWSMYKKFPVYRCSPTLPLRSRIDYMAFYERGKIKPVVPKVRALVDSLNLTQRESVDSIENTETRKLAEHLHERIRDDTHWRRQFDGDFKVAFLSETKSDETICLNNEIENNKTSESGKTVAFTYGKPRYFALESLKDAAKDERTATTTELERLEAEYKSGQVRR